MRILIVEPYFGGSHRTFLEGLMRAVQADYELLSLPARSWKQRMQLAAPWAATRLAEMAAGRRGFDTVLCSGFLDLALFRTLAERQDGWNSSARFCLYFHENQFAYPARFQDSAIRQFCYLNFTSALAADSVAFNSEYNRATFMHGCGSYLAMAKGMGVHECVDEMAAKSLVLHPGIDFTGLGGQKKEVTGPPVIVWNHRWEHDKGPTEFFNSLIALDDMGVDYKLIVLGQGFRDTPPCFAKARTRLGHRLIHFGYVPNREQYLQLLNSGDIVVSTALHEFFGMAVLEAVRAGCRPVLPDRLVYPELFSENYLYGEGELTGRLQELCENAVRLDDSTAVHYTDPYGWNCLRQPYEQWLAG